VWEGLDVYISSFSENTAFSLFQKEVMVNRNFEHGKELISATRKWVIYRNRMGIE
jgi:hypothetical protein